MKKRKFVELWTYGSYDSLNDTDFGISFTVPREWLKTKIYQLGYKSLNEFYNDYTWDITEILNISAENEAVLQSRRDGMFGHEIYKQK